jgi:hypothetical protein
MSRQPTQNLTQMLDPEKVAYWYFRLNGFLQIENFVVHPERRGSQRTDADLLAVRFPRRAERLFDDPNDIMADDEQGLRLSHDWIDVVIAEVKTNQPCTLNGPWTQPDHQNVPRVLAAIGDTRDGIAFNQHFEADGAIVFEHKNPAAPAVRREAEEDWGGKRATGGRRALR